MSDAKAKALARQQRILAKSQARMAVALGEASAISESDTERRTAEDICAPAEDQSAAASPVAEGASESTKPAPDTATAASNERDAVMCEAADATVAEASPQPKAGGILARRREKIQARSAALSPTASPATPKDPSDAILEEASEECLSSKTPKPGSVAGHAALEPSSPPVDPKPAVALPENKRSDATPLDPQRVPSIAEHSAAQGGIKKSRYMRLDKALIVRVVNLGLLFWISGINGYNADVRVVSRGLAEAAVDPRLAELKAFVQSAAGDGSGLLSSVNDEFSDSSSSNHLHGYSSSGDGVSWGQTIYSWLHGLTTGIFENSFACVIVVHWFIAPKLMPFVEQLLLLVGIVDSEVFKTSGAGGGGLISNVLSLVMGGFGGILGSVIDIFSYVAFHFILSIEFSVLFGYCMKLGTCTATTSSNEVLDGSEL